MVRASGLLLPTPPAALPADDSAGAIGSFGIQQTGQLERSNGDKRAAQAILDTCEEWQAKAGRARPWSKL